MSELANQLRAGGIAEAAVAQIVACIAREPAAAWDAITQTHRWLTPQHDFSLHQAVFEACFGRDALLHGSGVAWRPSADQVRRANATQLAKKIGLPDHSHLHRWSVEHREEYWQQAMQRLGVQFMRPYSRLLDATDFTAPRWLVDARLNIVASCFNADDTAPAIVQSDGVETRRISYGDLRRLVARAAKGLQNRGIGRGDAVALVMPMTIESAAAYLAIVAVGAMVVGIPESFSSDEIATRLRIAKAKLVITQDVIRRGEKILPLREKIQTATPLPSLVLSGNGGAVWEAFLANDDRFDPVPCDPHDPINILFSSGTTGDPKAIPWDHTTPIKAAADAHFHHDLHAGDVAAWPTSFGWMMGPWLIFSALMNRATIALYTQAPQERGFGQFVQTAGVTLLGTVPSLVRAWRQSGALAAADWSGIRAFSSTGECSNAADSFWLMHVAGYRPLVEYCGGTEIGGGYITSYAIDPCIPATFTTPALGLDMIILDEHDRPAQRGEAFLIGPSMGMSSRLLNRDHGQVYFTDTPALADHPRLRRHGDEIQMLPNGHFRVIGRCDDTMNLGGIKVGCAEIERVLEGVEGVQETAAVAESPPGGGPSRLVIFAVLKPGCKGSVDELKTHMRAAIRARLNPLFHLDEVRIVEALPRTASNKVMRRELRAQLG